MAITKHDFRLYKKILGHTHIEDYVKHRKKTAIISQKKDSSKEANTAFNLISDPSLQNCEEINFLCLGFTQSVVLCCSRGNKLTYFKGMYYSSLWTDGSRRLLNPCEEVTLRSKPRSSDHSSIVCLCVFKL